MYWAIFGIVTTTNQLGDPRASLLLILTSEKAAFLQKVSFLEMQWTYHGQGGEEEKSPLLWLSSCIKVGTGWNVL